MARSIEDIHERELNGLQRAYGAGMVAAIPAALRYCRNNRGLAAPPWLLDAAFDLLLRSIRGEKPKKVGRTANALARHRQDMIHFARWDAVKEVRQKQKEIAAEVAELRQLGDIPPDIMEERERMLQWVGRSWVIAYRCAVALLRGTESYGSPTTIKSSYMLVERASKDPAQAGRFRLLDHQTFRDLGLLHVFEPPREKKPAILFDPAR